MRSFLVNKLLIVTLSLLALAALMGLAIGLESMPFRERQVFGQAEAKTTSMAALQMVDAVLSIPIKMQLMFWSLFFALAFLIGLLMSPEMRKWLLRLALRAAAFYWLLYILATRYREVLAQMAFNFSPASGLPEMGADGATIPEFVPPTGASWLSYLVSFVLISLLLFVGWQAYTIWRRLNTATVPMDQLAKIARASLSDLSTGRDSTDVILNCYFRMSDVVNEKKRLDRKESMTPAEFATRLVQAGLPGDAVQRLTRLFESVRYGGHKTSSTMINEAVTCLTTILHYCGETV